MSSSLRLALFGFASAATAPLRPPSRHFLRARPAPPRQPSRARYQALVNGLLRAAASDRLANTARQDLPRRGAAPRPRRSTGLARACQDGPEGVPDGDDQLSRPQPSGGAAAPHDDDRHQSRQRHHHRLSRRAYGVRAGAGAGRPAAAGSPSCRTWRWRATWPRADRADRQSARPRARRQRLSQLRDAGGHPLRAGRPARARYRWPAGEPQGQPLLDDSGNPITLPADDPAITDRRGRHDLRAAGPDRPRRHRRLRARAGPRAGRRRPAGRQPRRRCRRPAPGWSRARSKAPTSSRSSR